MPCSPSRIKITYIIRDKRCVRAGIVQSFWINGFVRVVCADPNGVISSAVSLPNHSFIEKA